MNFSRGQLNLDYSSVGKCNSFVSEFLKTKSYAPNYCYSALFSSHRLDGVGTKINQTVLCQHRVIGTNRALKSKNISGWYYGLKSSTKPLKKGIPFRSTGSRESTDAKFRDS